MLVTRFAGLRSLLTVSALLGGVTLLTAPSAHAQAILDLFNTGVDNNGNLLAGGEADTHYTMIDNDAGLPNGTSALVNSDQLVGTYALNDTSQYISPDGADGSSINGGNYTLTYRTLFTLPTNVDLSSVDIEGSWSTDNLGDDILINGVSSGTTSTDYSTFTAFALPTTSFRAGVNTLDFVWTNQGGPGGLNVFYTTKTYSITNAAAAPEPASLGLLGVSLLPVGGVIARRRRVGRSSLT